MSIESGASKFPALSLGFVLASESGEAASDAGLLRVASETSLCAGQTAFALDAACALASAPQCSALATKLDQRLKSVVEGRNGVFLGFGAKQDGSRVCPALFGVFPSAARDAASPPAAPSGFSVVQAVLAAFAKAREQNGGKAVVHMSAVEIAGERVFDLVDFATGQQAAVSSSAIPAERRLKFESGGAAGVDGLSFVELTDPVGSGAAIVASCLRGSFRCGVSAPPAPLVAQSTNVIVQLYLTRKEPGQVFRSVVSLVDLCCDFIDPPGASGSASSAAAGNGLTSPASPPLTLSSSSSSPPQYVFTSSLVARRCVDQVCGGGSAAAAPYRQSTLTMLLSDVFTGNGMLALAGVVAASDPQLSLAVLRVCQAMKQGAAPLAARVNAERVAGAMSDMRSEVEELRRRLEAERQSRDEAYGARAQEVADMETRRRLLEQEQRAKKALNAKALASISKQMRTLQALQAQLNERQSLLSAANEAKEQRRAAAEEDARRQERLRREAEVAAMREQEAILQRQIAVQLEAQLAVQRKLREDAERTRADLLAREMSFVFRAAAQRTRDEAETAALRDDVAELRLQLDDMTHEERCMRATIAALEVHVAALDEQHTYLEARHKVMDALLNDGIEARARDIRDAERCLADSQARLRALAEAKSEVEAQTAAERAALERDCLPADASSSPMSAAAAAASASSSPSSAASPQTTLKRLRAVRDRKRAALDHLSKDNEMLRVKRAAAQDAAHQAHKAAQRAAHELREAELLNARRRMEETELGEQLADTLRASAALRKRARQLEGSIAALRVQLHETEQRRDTAESSQAAFEAFLGGGHEAPSLAAAARLNTSELARQSGGDESRSTTSGGGAVAAAAPSTDSAATDPALHVNLVPAGIATSAHSHLLNSALALSAERKEQLRRRLGARLSRQSTAASAVESHPSSLPETAPTSEGAERAAKRIALSLAQRK
jgi:hypothetical protein